MWNRSSFRSGVHVGHGRKPGQTLCRTFMSRPAGASSNNMRGVTTYDRRGSALGLSASGRASRLRPTPWFLGKWGSLEASPRKWSASPQGSGAFRRAALLRSPS